jgi:NADH:ubiquinone oxidoreductase subunit 3 (subunit A)
LNVDRRFGETLSLHLQGRRISQARNEHEARIKQGPAGHQHGTGNKQTRAEQETSTKQAASRARNQHEAGSKHSKQSPAGHQHGTGNKQSRTYYLLYAAFLIEAICFFAASVDFQRTTLFYIFEDKTLHFIFFSTLQVIRL